MSVTSRLETVKKDLLIALEALLDGHLEDAKDPHISVNEIELLITDIRRLHKLAVRVENWDK